MGDELTERTPKSKPCDSDNECDSESVTATTRHRLQWARLNLSLTLEPVTPHTTQTRAPPRFFSLRLAKRRHRQHNQLSTSAIHCGDMKLRFFTLRSPNAFILRLLVPNAAHKAPCKCVALARSSTRSGRCLMRLFGSECFAPRCAEIKLRH